MQSGRSAKASEGIRGRGVHGHYNGGDEKKIKLPFDAKKATGMKRKVLRPKNINIY
jgi:hypothetical protein